MVPPPNIRYQAMSDFLGTSDCGIITPPRAKVTGEQWMQNNLANRPGCRENCLGRHCRRLSARHSLGTFVDKVDYVQCTMYIYKILKLARSYQEKWKIKLFSLQSSKISASHSQISLSQSLINYSSSTLDIMGGWGQFKECIKMQAHSKIRQLASCSWPILNSNNNPD